MLGAHLAAFPRPEIGPMGLHPSPAAEAGDTLGACLRRVYLLQVGPDGAGRPFVMDASGWPRTVRAVARALRRIGGPVRFGEGRPGDPTGTALVARAGRNGSAVVLAPVAGDVADGLPGADDFDMEGRPLR